MDITDNDSRNHLINHYIAIRRFNMKKLFSILLTLCLISFSFSGLVYASDNEELREYTQLGGRADEFVPDEIPHHL